MITVEEVVWWAACSTERPPSAPPSGPGEAPGCTRPPAAAPAGRAEPCGRSSAPAGRAEPCGRSSAPAAPVECKPPPTSPCLTPDLLLWAPPAQTPGWRRLLSGAALSFSSTWRHRSGRQLDIQRSVFRCCGSTCSPVKVWRSSRLHLVSLQRKRAALGPPARRALSQTAGSSPWLVTRVPVWWRTAAWRWRGDTNVDDEEHQHTRETFHKSRYTEPRRRHLEPKTVLQSDAIEEPYLVQQRTF